MKITKVIWFVVFSFSISACSIHYKQRKGNVLPEGFYYKTKFTTVKSVIVLPFQINGVKKNFLFDTGADYNLIQRDAIIGKKGMYSGASKRKMKMGSEITKSMKIGNVNFVDTYGVNADLKGLKEQIPNFGGLIGQSIISKGNWLIDYPNKIIEVSDKDMSDDSFQSIKIIREDGAPYVLISINGNTHKVLVDFGSSSDFNLPKNSKLAKKLLDMYNFKDSQRERYTIGGLQTITEKKGIVPLITLETIEFENVKTTINVSSQPRIGIGFFKDCLVYIDNTNRQYKIKKPEN
ncbi:hypothetical protein ATO12_18065 [Aquimarina atlantica]|uniref:Peptidase A2 domain-containing protein n=1 Tax=Aquimarina atlantica TaxID=1317122 RepID=A0A023BVK0_9FLAO|nr:hypothetical protein [Aquimarina atlantica]EZH73838.1 hypothetical protein ATO12_18065 [Aquimarina atlantica]